MPLGNLTSQFFANVYLNELDQFVKNKLKVRFYIRYVDDFIILHNKVEQLEEWKGKIDTFLKEKLRVELHPQKSRIIKLKNGIDFVGFRHYRHYKLLRKRNIKKVKMKVRLFGVGLIDREKLFEGLQGWNAYAKWADSYGLRKEVVRKVMEGESVLKLGKLVETRVKEEN